MPPLVVPVVPEDPKAEEAPALPQLCAEQPEMGSVDLPISRLLPRRRPSSLAALEAPAAPMAEHPEAESPKAESPEAEFLEAEYPEAEFPKAELPKAESPEAVEGGDAKILTAPGSGVLCAAGDDL